METKRMEEMYRIIGQTLHEIIPGEWKKIVLYAEVLDDSSEVFFYFQTPQNDEFEYSHLIPELYGVDETIYTDILFELHDHFRSLQNEFMQQGQSVWSSLTLVLESTGKFKIDYDYQNPVESELDDYQRQFVWEYRNLGKWPKSEDNQKWLEDHLKNKR
ncbi:immunity protein YezG family protein [Tumebacillus flagellatus]|uniref:Cytoplasmic protein n=1 Tax=Tumebacillus flagellatus TaxID=1157490 RepID=A0A074M6G8_9BACL|nr:immunity protein YezG family protein [Tumebacillus flagellatus]KEO81577.1 hypothetical protein EL26_20040 [Tumebacillus flagellatus]